MKNTKTAAVCLIMVIILLAGLTGCQSNSQGLSQQETASETGTDNDSAILPVTLTAGYASFAPYQQIPVNLNPSIEGYRVAHDLSNVTNKEQFKFSKAAQNLLAKNGFVVVPGKEREFSALKLIAIARSNFVTTDAMLHNTICFQPPASDPERTNCGMNLLH